MKITIIENGPALIEIKETENVEISHLGDSNRYSNGDIKIYLCRCGKSKNYTCDGSHKQVNQ